MAERTPTHDEFERWQRDAKSDVRTVEARLTDFRAELRAELLAVREENARLRERLTRVEGFREWHDRAWDPLVAKVDRIDRLVLLAAGAGAATGGAVATALKLIGGS